MARKNKPARRPVLALPKLDRNSRARAFAGALGDALAVVSGLHGDRWAFREDLAVLVRVPAPLASWVDQWGIKHRVRRDLRVPAPRFWPAGALWPGLVIQREGKRETRMPLDYDRKLHRRACELREAYEAEYARLRVVGDDLHGSAFSLSADAARKLAYERTIGKARGETRGEAMASAGFPRLALAESVAA